MTEKLTDQETQVPEIPTPPAPTKSPELAREMLRLAREREESHIRATDYFIVTAREHHGLTWIDIAHETGISEPTCRRRAARYLGEIEELGDAA